MADIIQQIQFKRGTKENLEAVLKNSNKPAAGEPIWEYDTNKMKIGDGINNYADLPYISGGSDNQIFFASRYEFPSVGEENKLYIAKDEQNAYIFKNGHYSIVSVDNREIDCGGASTQY